MTTNDQYFLSFIEPVNQVAAQNAKKMEELIYEDAGSSIVKARLFLEAILDEVYKIEKLESTYGQTLYERISYLTRNEYIDRKIQQSFDTIRLSGNKAAHDGNFNDITVAFKLHKEMYNIAVWFVEVYTIDQVKIPIYEVPKPPKPDVDIEDLVHQKILQLLGTNSIGTENKEEGPAPMEAPLDNSNELFENNLPDGESYLIRELRRLQDSSQEAIENANQFSRFKNYMHVDRQIQLDFEKILKGRTNTNKGNLILLCGSVGDGKSHLLAYLKENKSELLKEYTIYNDATESFSPGKNAMETLEEVLKGFSDERIDQTHEKIILAINMGVLHNFINEKHQTYSYKRLKEFVETSGLFSPDITTHFSEGNTDLLSFGDYHSYELTESGPTSSFYLTLFKRIFSKNELNPFTLALTEDEKRDKNTMAHENFRMLQSEFVQKQIVQLLVEAIVKHKLVISARAFLNFVADIILPDDDDQRPIEFMSEFEILKNSVPTLLFNRKERSGILYAMSKLDPIHKRSVHIDHIVIELNTLNDWEGLISEHIHSAAGQTWLKPLANDAHLIGESFNLFFRTFIRVAYISNQSFATNLRDSNFASYLRYLYNFNVRNMDSIITFYGEIKSAIFNWKGTPKKDYIYVNKADEKFRLAQQLNLKPYANHLKHSSEEILSSFKSTILIGYHDGDSSNKEFLDIDFPLYELLMKVQEGYRPNKKDKEDAIKFVEYIEKLMAFGEQRNEMLIHYPDDKKYYKIKKDDFDRFVFEREN